MTNAKIYKLKFGEKAPEKKPNGPRREPGTGGVLKHGRKWCSKIIITGADGVRVPYRDPIEGCTDKAMALKVLEVRLGLLAVGQYPPKKTKTERIPFEACSEAAIQDTIARNGSVRTTQSLLRRLVRHYGLKGKIMSGHDGELKSEVTTEYLRTKRAERIEGLVKKHMARLDDIEEGSEYTLRSQAQSTTNKEIGLVRRMFNLLVRDEKLEPLSNPLGTGKLPPFDEQENAKLAYPSVEEIGRAYVAALAEPEFLPLFQFGILAGLRLWEIRRAKKTDVDMVARTIRVGRSKSRKQRFVPLNDELFEITKKLMEEPGRYLVGGDTPPTDRTVRDAWDRIRAMAEIQHLTFHSLRHGFASHFIQGGGSLELLQEMLGHSDIRITRKYVHHDNKHRLAGAQIVGKVYQAATGETGSNRAKFSTNVSTNSRSKGELTDESTENSSLTIGKDLVLQIDPTETRTPVCGVRGPNALDQKDGSNEATAGFSWLVADLTTGPVQAKPGPSGWSLVPTLVPNASCLANAVEPSVEQSWAPVIRYPRGRPPIQFEGYEVHPEGLVRSLRSPSRFGRLGPSEPRILRPVAQAKGYLVVWLSLGQHGLGRSELVHLIVLDTFRGPSPPRMYARHIDGDITNNRLDNLIWSYRSRD